MFGVTITAIIRCFQNNLRGLLYLYIYCYQFGQTCYYPCTAIGSEDFRENYNRRLRL